MFLFAKEHLLQHGRCFHLGYQFKKFHGMVTPNNVGGAMDRAYSVLNVKSFDAEKRIIEGMATTPQPDRAGDIVVPTGAKFKNPMPLLWQHKHELPIGTVEFGRPTADGIPFKAQLPDVKEAGSLKDRVDEAWHSVKYGLVSAVSIGFQAAQDGIERLKSGGLKFKEWECFELSLVTIPANAGAVITAIKSIDSQHLLPATGESEVSAVESPGATGKKSAQSGAVKLITKRK